MKCFKYFRIVALAIFLSFTSLQAMELHLAKGWNLAGTDVNISNLSTLFPEIDLVWKYDGNSWSVASPSGKYNSKIYAQTKYEPIWYIEAGSGFWAYIDKDENYSVDGNTLEDKKIYLNDGWQLISVKNNEDVNVSGVFSSSYIQIVWKYNAFEKRWEAYSPIYNDNSIDEIKTVKAENGFWILSNKNLILDPNNDKTNYAEVVLSTGDKTCFDFQGSTTSCLNENIIKSDAYFQKGLKRSFTRDDTNDILIDNTTHLMWEDDENVKTVKKPLLSYEHYKTCVSKSDISVCYDLSGDTAYGYCQNLRLGGYYDWRIPTIEELRTIIDYGDIRIVPKEMKNIVQDESYWSKSTSIKDESLAWEVSFKFGTLNTFDKVTPLHVRCVRGGQDIYKRNFIRTENNQTLIDITHNLEWQDAPENETIKEKWLKAVEYCDSLEYAGHNDWRLPNANELLSLTESARTYYSGNVFNNIYIDPNFGNSYCWSSTNMASSINTSAIYVDLVTGKSFIAVKSIYAFPVRCVRDR